MELFGTIFIAFVFGIIIGKLIESARWRKNANDIVRIYSAGHLYKVIHNPPPGN